MNIETKFLGQIEIDEQNILTFETGLPGFLDVHKFVLLPLDADLPLVVLQSVEQQELGFVLAYPFAFKKDYMFEISEEEKIDLQVEEEEDVIAYTIVTLKETFSESTMNLLAPIIINTKKKLGKQIVLQDSKRYPLRHPIGSMEGSAK
ncbi:MAG: flagellar assembly protein FliW [Lysinibacillus fusiformis]|uniref:flagellar assembly protein FliW n=1 Tax=Metasolibacillus sp. TaxID=2703680 RepID=UPI0025E7F33C|nr:flagellar assembly protein FliW [Metasolibacillus sp.]MCT6818663.1 flagellar assembly protein FliW [Lysinibacillus fusiformis]MCT6925680.1 flagellar assembly protein FliW [Metasolibacillus sp.]MCT6941000.1 flagellar assembly protein FliW [Metasolibacillus sp.]